MPIISCEEDKKYSDKWVVKQLKVCRYDFRNKALIMSSDIADKYDTKSTAFFILLLLSNSLR